MPAETGNGFGIKSNRYETGTVANDRIPLQLGYGMHLQ
jgi:hypothetical protein